MDIKEESIINSQFEDIVPLDGSFRESSDHEDFVMASTPREKVYFATEIEVATAQVKSSEAKNKATNDTQPLQDKRKEKKTCNVCQKSVLPKNFKTHMKTHDGNYVKCEFCPAKFTDSWHLNDHTNRHTHPFMCDTCGKHFLSRPGLKLHIDGHKGDGLLSCYLCTKTFATKQHFEGHRNSVHLNYKPFKCPLCEKGFSYAQNFQRHKQGCSQNVPKYNCDICNSEFKSKRAKQEHTEAVHGNKELRCSCGKLYKWKRSFNRHRETCNLPLM